MTHRVDVGDRVTWMRPNWSGQGRNRASVLKEASGIVAIRLSYSSTVRIFIKPDQPMEAGELVCVHEKDLL